jgi:hypothetical protein
MFCSTSDGWRDKQDAGFEQPREIEVPRWKTRMMADARSPGDRRSKERQVLLQPRNHIPDREAAETAVQPAG